MATPIQDLQRQLKAIEVLLSRNPELEIPEELKEQSHELLGKICGESLPAKKRTAPKSLSVFKSEAEFAASNEFLDCPVCKLPVLLTDYSEHSQTCQASKRTLREQRRQNKASTSIEKVPSVSESGPKNWHRTNQVANLKMAKPQKDNFVSDESRRKEFLLDASRVQESKLDASKDQWHHRDQGKYGSMSAHDDHNEEGEL